MSHTSVKQSGNDKRLRGNGRQVARALENEVFERTSDIEYARPVGGGGYPRIRAIFVPCGSPYGMANQQYGGGGMGAMGGYGGYGGYGGGMPATPSSFIVTANDVRFNQF
ncbi:hypothetical protein I4U23_015780 [Adineta vaga]|nr:hypothetical protein I4U23_015780 [Adineta vaga]